MAPRRRARRAALTTEQMEGLTTAFAEHDKCNAGRAELLASQLNLLASQVVNWFHNHRAKLRRQQKERERLEGEQQQPEPADGGAAACDTEDPPAGPQVPPPAYP